MPTTATPQPVIVPLTRAAIFLVVTINPSAEALDAMRAMCADIAPLVRAVGFRDEESKLTCVMGFGSSAWDRLFGQPKPPELHQFREIRADSRHAVSTPGDVLFHIRAERMDLCFELASLITARLGDTVTVADEVHGFRYFDARDLLGFVDGTENPGGQEAIDAALIPDGDQFAGGSYVIVQKYLHDISGWNALTTEEQERIIGRTKLSDVELDDSIKPTSAHSALNTIVEDGQEMKILRANMAFGQVGRGEFGTYFIGYARTVRITEQMLTNMFVGRPPGNYDHILDFSRAVTGNLFFVPSATLLEALAEAQAAQAVAPAAAPPAMETPASNPPLRDGSLGIGSLKG
jgi:porphyrinogen peroxidase